MSKIIKSFTHIDSSGGDQEVVIGLQPVSNYITLHSYENEDDESRIARLKNEAAELLEKAKTEAAQIREDAEVFRRSQREKLDAEKIELLHQMEQQAELARQNGYEDGYQHGINQGLEQWHAKLNEVRVFIDKTKEDYYQILNEAEPQMISLAVKTAEKIIGDKLHETPETWTSFIKQLVKEVRESQEIKLYVPTDWFEATLAYREELKNLLQANANLFIYPDESLRENGAVIEFPFGKIDASIDVQLKEIREKLLEQIEVSEN
ncbi:flagellar assembly protein FliH [Fictibacillus barbaricus]|uniref:Flagellar assembly protein FliH n=1 Tax=Fictibacillus barbaricus TaxID=182136 RepID=A0ABU1TY48_9BACL|nr:flagellar assembly protein FliH [Fictibacillus barbaricus]MDR7072139.1 flagellar assembly protein FliH [Fictibacillus barbaricus]